MGAVRGLWAVLLLAAVAAGEEDPFAPTIAGLGGEEAVERDTYCRVIESLALVKEQLARDPADPRALDRALELFAIHGRQQLLEPTFRNALRGDPAPERAGRIKGLLAHLLVEQTIQNANVWVIAGGQIQRGGLGLEERAKLTLAVDMLREALRVETKSVRVRRDLVSALLTLDAQANAEEVVRLQAQIDVLVAAATPPPPPPAYPAQEEAAQLRGVAEQMEQKETDPDHAGALLLRKRALVLDYCAWTIPFEYDASLYGPVSLLAPEEFIQSNLQRSFRKRDGSIGTVAALYYPPPLAQRLQIVAGLAKDQGAAAGALLLRLVASRWEEDALTAAAVRSLVEGGHPAVREHLTRMLQSALFSGDTDHYPLPGQVRLVRLAARLKPEGVAPVLAGLLPRDTDVAEPRWIAAALGATGGPEQADALLAVARDPERDVFFRREAILALGRVAPDRLDDVSPEPYLELALAAARYRAAPSDALRGRILNGIGNGHETDDAARLCVEFDLREAIGPLERFCADHPDDYACPIARHALETLTTRSKS